MTSFSARLGQFGDFWYTRSSVTTCSQRQHESHAIARKPCDAASNLPHHHSSWNFWMIPWRKSVSLLPPGWEDHRLISSWLFSEIQNCVTSTPSSADRRTDERARPSVAQTRKNNYWYRQAFEIVTIAGHSRCRYLKGRFCLELSINSVDSINVSRAVRQAAKFRNKKDWDRSFVHHVICHVA